MNYYISDFRLEPFYFCGCVIHSDTTKKKKNDGNRMITHGNGNQNRAYAYKAPQIYIRILSFPNVLIMRSAMDTFRWYTLEYYVMYEIEVFQKKLSKTTSSNVICFYDTTLASNLHFRDYKLQYPILYYHIMYHVLHSAATRTKH